MFGLLALMCEKHKENIVFLSNKLRYAAKTLTEHFIIDLLVMCVENREHYVLSDRLCM